MSVVYETVAKSGSAQKAAMPNPTTQLPTTIAGPRRLNSSGRDTRITTAVVMRWVSAVRASNTPVDAVNPLPSRTFFMRRPR